MILLNKKYNSQELAKELQISYGGFRNNRFEYEHYLNCFYDFKKEIAANGVTIEYTFLRQMSDLIPYREFKKMRKNKIIQKHIKKTIEKDNRQTGSNIARIIYTEKGIYGLNLALSTLKVYVREQLKELVHKGYYDKGEYEWCYLDSEKNVYILMSKEEIEDLKNYFINKELTEQETEIWSKYSEKEITYEDAVNQVGQIRYGNFIEGLKNYQEQTGHWAMKVPVYTVNVFMLDLDEEDKETIERMLAGTI